MAMSKMLKLCPNSGLMEMGKYISQLAKNSEHSRVVLITRGKEPLIVVQGKYIMMNLRFSYFRNFIHAHTISLLTGEEILHCPTFTVPDSAIVDTNGAGDAFAGGLKYLVIQLLLNYKNYFAQDF